MSATVISTSKEKVDCARLERVARAVMAAEGCSPDTELSVVIGDDAWIQELNRKYKRQDRQTDVLAFPQGENLLLGDVAISRETAERQARELGHPVNRELDILMTHGILHLTGWTDDTPERRERMMERTQQLLTEVERCTEP